MARKAREDFESEVFHIVVQGINREKIFEGTHFKVAYLDKLNAEKEAYGVKILAYCVMDSHCHLLLHVESIDKMSRYMQKVNTTFAQYYNFKEDRVGFVFRDRFKSQAIYDEQYLVNCLVYIHNNPVKAGIASRAETYKFSSCKDYMSQSGIVDFEDAKNFFDPSAENVSRIAIDVKGDDCDIEWIDCKEDLETPLQKAERILKKYPVPAKFLRSSKVLFVQAIEELASAGLSQSEIAELFEISNSYVNMILKGTRKQGRKKASNE